MTTLSINGRLFTPALLIFDKDGTILDFHHLWGQKSEQWVEMMVQQVNGDEQLRQELHHRLGYDPATNRVVDDSPLAIDSMPVLYEMATAVLHKHGHHHNTRQQILAAAAASITELPTAEQIKPRGDVAGLFRQLTQAGIQIAIVTSDDRAATEATLVLLDIEKQVSILVCGDDDIANKPAPDGILHISSQLGVDVAEIMMVGDTTGDMMTGINAGVGYRLGIAFGAGNQAELAAHADLVIDSLDEIHITTHS